MVVRASWLLPLTAEDGQTREDTRLAQGMLMAPDTAITSASGIRPGAGAGSPPFDLVAASAMQCTIKPGLAFIQGTTAQGGYNVYSDADTTLTFSAGNATNPRIDLVVLRVYDDFIDEGGETYAAIEIVEGTPAAVPTVPALPSATSLALWQVRVNANVSAGNGGINSNPGWSSARTDRRVYTVAAGGIRPASGGWTGSYDGQYRDNGTDLERWYSATGRWNAPYAKGLVTSRRTDTSTIALAGGPWLIVELGTITMTWSSTRKYKLTATASLQAVGSANNGANVQIRYKSGSSIPNDQNPSSSTVIEDTDVGFDAVLLSQGAVIVTPFDPSVTETGTIGLFWTHGGPGTTKVVGDMLLMVEDAGPR